MGTVTAARPATILVVEENAAVEELIDQASGWIPADSVVRLEPAARPPSLVRLQ
jgi:hypothetical protein